MFNRGDLLIRDLGYFVISALTQIQQKGAFFITRLKHGVVLSDPHSGKRIQLLKMLRKSNKIDIQVHTGARERLLVRLVAIPVDPMIAEQRRRKLKTNRDSRLNPSKEHLALMGWNLFLLNVDAETLSVEEIGALYGLRWRIETIFKSWKSQFHLTADSRMSALYLRVSLYAHFIVMTLFHTVIVAPTMITTAKQCSVSLLKLSRCIREQFWAIIMYVVRPAVLFDLINYYCAYEKRRDRLNYSQKVAALS